VAELPTSASFSEVMASMLWKIGIFLPD